MQRSRYPMSCIICGHPKIHAKNRCHCCYNYRSLNGIDRSPKHIKRLDNYRRKGRPHTTVNGFLCACRQGRVSHRVSVTILTADLKPTTTYLYLCDTCYQLNQELSARKVTI